MKNIKNIVAIFLATITLSACDLSQMPKDQLTYEDPSEIFYDVTEAGYYINGIAAYYRSCQQGLYWLSSEKQGDMFNISTTSGNRGGDLHRMDATFTSSQYDIEDIWQANYAVIAQCNYFLLNVPNINTAELSDADLARFNTMIGRAYFFRAAAYHTLGSQFALPYSNENKSTLCVPLITYPDVSELPSRNTIEEIYALILSDLNNAKTKLADTPGAIRSILPTIDAANALDARVQLWMGNHTDAIAAAELVINSSAGYTLSASVAQLEKEFVTQDGSESILQLARTQTEGGPSNNSVFLQFNKTEGGVDFYNADFFPSKRLIDLYEDTDIRKAVYLAEVNFIYNSTEFITNGFTKYQGNPALTSNSYMSGVTAARVFALPEMYLIKAEAEAMSGNTTAAEATINVLQTARGAALTDGSMANIQDEWARETVGEGHRIVCLQRWNLGFVDRPQVSIATDGLGTVYLSSGEGNQIIDIPAGYYKLVWPIPSSDIQINPNLVQNPGW